MVAFLAGAGLALMAPLILIVQLVSALSRPKLKPALPRALAATAAAFFAGCFLGLAAEFHWVSGSALDTIALPVAAVALAWIFFNRLSSRKRFRGEKPPDDTERAARHS